MSDAYLDWKHWEVERFGRCPDSESRYFAWHIRKARLPAPPNRVLEIGFGNGNFLGYCRSQGWQAAGIEVNEILKQRATAAGFQVHQDVHVIPETEHFELIAAFDVLEHMPIDQAQTFLATLRSRLAPQGAILLRVPNGDSPFGRTSQHGDRTHIETYGLGKLRQISLAAGLTITRSGEAPWYAQQERNRTPRTFLRAVLRKILDRLICFAYFGGRMDLSPNILVVLKAN